MTGENKKKTDKPKQQQIRQLKQQQLDKIQSKSRTRTNLKKLSK